LRQFRKENLNYFLVRLSKKLEKLSLNSNRLVRQASDERRSVADDQESLRKSLFEVVANLLDSNPLATEISEPLKKILIGHIVKCSSERIISKFENLQDLISGENDILRVAEVRMIIFSELSSTLAFAYDRYASKAGGGSEVFQAKQLEPSATSSEESSSLLPQNTFQASEGPRYMTKRRNTNFASVD